MIQQGSDFGFVGEAYEAPMLLQDAQRCVNWYVEITEDKTNGSKMPIALLGCPGLKSIFDTGTASEVRGLWVLPGGATALVVVGNVVYLLTTSLQATSTTSAVFTATQVGTLLTYTGPVSMRDNGVVFGGKGGFVVIVDGTYGYYYLISGVPNVITFTAGVVSGSATVTPTAGIPNGLVVTPSATITDTSGYIPANTTFTGVNFNSVTLSMSANATNTNASDTVTITIPVFGQITDAAFLPASMVAFIEGWLIFSQPGTRTFFTNATTPYTLLFSGSFYALKDSSTDNLVTLYENNRELWLIGARTSEVWYDAGNANFAFARIPAIGPQMGCAATHSITRMGPDLVWLGKNEQGQNIVVKQNNYQWERISTHAIDKAIASYPVVSDAIGFAYEEEGHWFYVLTFPTADVTWCYDGKTQMWHRRGSWDASIGDYHRFRGQSFCNLSNTRLVGDYQNGKLYQMSRSFYSDDGNPLRCQRRAPHVWEKQNRKRLFHGQFQIEFTPGVGSASPQANTTGYNANAISFNGTTSYLNSAGLTAIADGKQGTICWFGRIDSNATTQVLLSIGSGPKFVVEYVSGQFRVVGRNSAGTTILDIQTVNTYSVGSTWYSLQISWNLATSTTNFIVNGVSDKLVNTLTNDTINYSNVVSNTYIGRAVAGGLYASSASEIWFDPTSTIDFSKASNIALFQSGGFPISLGANGQLPTGSSPILYLKNSAATFGTNSGMGGNLTINGTFSDTTGPSYVAPTLNGYNPQAMLRWYDYNKNKNWSNEHWQTIGKTGEVTNRCIWRRLGSSRDRIYELNFSDPVPRDIVGVTLFFEPEEEVEAQLVRTG